MLLKTKKIVYRHFEIVCRLLWTRIQIFEENLEFLCRQLKSGKTSFETSERKLRQTAAADVPWRRPVIRY